MKTIITVFFLLLAASALADTLQYDPAGNITSHTTSQGTNTYTYDALNRITSEAGPNATQNFTYDANGNRLSDGLGAYSYSSTSDQMTARHGAAVSFDAAGHLTSDGLGHAFVYNQAGRLYQVFKNSVLLASYYPRSGDWTCPSTHTESCRARRDESEVG